MTSVHHQTAVSYNLKESFARRVLRKGIVLLYRLLAPFRNIPIELHQIFPEFAQGDKALKPRLRVLAIVPFKDKADLTQICYRGLLEQELSGIDLTIALVDNNSCETSTHQWLQEIQNTPDPRAQVRVLSYDKPFNFSYLNNQALRDCSDLQPDIVAFINNDIEFVERSTIKTLAQLCASSDGIGAVGCTLLFPDLRIQHLFVYVGSKIVGSHPLRGKPFDQSRAWYKAVREVPGVTGAVMFVKTRDFLQVDGFDEVLATSYQDVDLCLKLQKLNRKNLTVPFVVNVHHETQTRSKDPNWNEAAYAYKKWGEYLRSNPSVPQVYSRLSEDLIPGIAYFERKLQLIPESAVKSAAP
jgi:GT2 family glycosyltransferase